MNTTEPSPLAGTSLLIGVSGGIAAFKTAALVSQLVQCGATVQVVATGAARRFIGDATFAALTGRPVVSELFDDRFPLGAHIELARDAGLLLIAPATADCIAKMATGQADDLLSTIYLCFAGPTLAAPAMNVRMWQQPSVQRNVQQIQEDGVEIIAPQDGWLSCREQGAGRMAEPDALLRAIEQRLAREGFPRQGKPSDR